MNCPKCNSENDDNAHFCSHCGTNLKTPNTKEGRASSIMLFVYIVYISFFTLLNFLLKQFFMRVDLNTPTRSYIYVAIGMVEALLFILIPLSIKDKKLKIIGLIIAVVTISYWCYNDISGLLLALKKFSEFSS